MLLAIDTSTDWCSVALYDPTAGLLSEATWRAGREQTTQLLPEANRLLTQQGLSPTDLIGVAVATGPGSFTGLRVGLATAKGLAFALELPLWGVPTLDVLAYSHMAITVAPVCAVLRAGRGRLAHAFYRTSRGIWRRISDYRNTTVEELIDQVEIPTMFCGEIDSAVAAELERRLDGMALVMPRAASARRAAYLAEIAWGRAQQGETDDLAGLQAIYLQSPTVAASRAPAEPAVKF